MTKEQLLEKTIEIQSRMATEFKLLAISVNEFKDTVIELSNLGATNPKQEYSDEQIEKADKVKEFMTDDVRTVYSFLSTLKD